MLSDKNKIKEVIGRKVYNSQGFATIEVEITLENGLKAWASAPRGSTKGNFETTYVESYINGIERTPNIDTAIANINNIVAPALKGKCFKSIEEFDKVLVSLDKTDRKKIIGGNCTLAASYAMLKLLSLIEKKPIYKLFNNISDSEVLPIFNMIDGSKHPKSCLNGVEILLIPKKDKWHNNITKLFDAVSLINSTLKELLIEENYIVEVSNQGALSILEDNMEKCLEYLKLSLEKEGYSLGLEFSFGLDLAVSDSFDEQSKIYNIPWAPKFKHSTDLIRLYKSWINKYHIDYIEDAFADTDYEGWESFVNIFNNMVMISGDDLFATNINRLNSFYKIANMAVVKPNQIGTISETIDFIRKAKDLGIKMLISQRTGETDDVIITHLAYAFDLMYLKAGGIQRMERVAKFNELIRIKEWENNNE